MEKKRGRSERSENITEREKIRAKNRRETCSEKIVSESEKSSAEQSGTSSVVQNDAEKGEDPIR